MYNNFMNTSIKYTFCKLKLNYYSHILFKKDIDPHY